MPRPIDPIRQSDLPSRRKPLPQGYRQGLITAITVLLGFTLAFFRFWGFEASGEWTRRSFITASGLTVALILQVVALFRSLRVQDDDEAEYVVTVRWLIASAIVLVAVLVGAAAVYSGAF